MSALPFRNSCAAYLGLRLRALTPAIEFAHRSLRFELDIHDLTRFRVALPV